MKDPRKLFARRLKKLRLEKGWSQEKLALEANVDRSYLNYLEGAKNSPTLDVLHKLAQALNIPPALLLIYPQHEQQVLQALKKNKGKAFGPL